ncbi:MAG: glycosyltransferase family 39 protein [Pirellulaceae bacterium]|nr:glycosyltransferase family 39 protein [Pirellulaceae bacterium]
MAKKLHRNRQSTAIHTKPRLLDSGRTGQVSNRSDAPPDKPVDSVSGQGRGGWWILLAMLLHVAIAGHAASTKSATFDEPLHVLGGLLQWRHSDYRLNPEHPPLWKHWAALFSSGLPLQVDLASADSQVMFSDLNKQERWAVGALFRSPNHDGVQLVDRTRLGMLVTGAWVVLIVGLWARQLAGNMAGTIAACAAAIDPTLLAHSGLVTNDVACTAALATCFFCGWRVARHASLGNVLGFSLACGLAAVIKFTALALPAFLAPWLLLRLTDRRAWQVVLFGNVTSLSHRLAALSTIVLLAGTVSWLCIWAAYGFRYLPTPNPRLSFDRNHPTQLYQFNLQLRAQHRDNQHSSSTQHKRSTGDTAPTQTVLQRLCQVANDYRLLPQAFIQGVGYAQAMSIIGSSYLDGHQSHEGSWRYFVWAWLYKTPLAMIVAVALACAWCGWQMARTGRRQWLSLGYWAIPFWMVIATALSYDLNIGLRHLLPAFPLVWIGLGSMAAQAWLHVPAQRVVIGLLALLAVESLSSHPHYIAFFNLAASGKDRGLSRLSDSNLDWGQDLRLLAAWQRDNPDVPLYFAYFGSADPAAYGIDYINLPPGYLYGAKPVEPDTNQPAVLALSATWLQGNYMHWLEGTFLDPRQVREQMDMIRNQAEPLEILGGTIYLYQFPLIRKDEPSQ